MINIEICPVSALKDNYIWVVVNTRHQCALVVDPGEASPVVAYLKNNHLTLSGVLVTHHHWDHVNGITDLIKQYPAPVYGSVLSQYPHLTHRVAESEGVSVNHFPTYQVMTIPGHTLDHVAYFANDALFCGDTLFAGGCGRLFEGSVEQLYASLQKISAFPAQTKIYCAHEYTLNNLRFAQQVEPNNQHINERIEKIIKLRAKNLPSIPSLLIEEQQTNPFLRCDIAEVILHVERHTKKSLNNPLAVFAELRRWKDGFL